jgi:class 3 adenylate cyclase
MATNHGQRSRFLVRRFCEAQLEQLRTVLHDLLPPVVVSTMINISARFPPENCLAAVLQLDICVFTDLSRTIPPMQLALLMHKLFTYFDETVSKQGLFKMDTIGDACIVAALLTEGQPVKSHCLGMLEVAKTIQTTQRNDKKFQRTSNFFQKALKQQLFSEE